MHLQKQVKKSKTNKNPKQTKTNKNPKNFYGFSLGKHSTSLNSIVVSSIKELVKPEVYKSVKIFCLGDTKR